MLSKKKHITIMTSDLNKRLDAHTYIHTCEFMASANTFGIPGKT